jgi:hypothetical protein
MFPIFLPAMWKRKTHYDPEIFLVQKLGTLINMVEVHNLFKRDLGFIPIKVSGFLLPSSLCLLLIQTLNYVIFKLEHRSYPVERS